MPKALHKYHQIGTPRCLTTRDVAFYLGLSEGWLSDHRAQLQAAGFPTQDHLTGRYDKAAIDRWLDARAGLDAPSGSYDPDLDQKLAELEEEYGT